MKNFKKSIALCLSASMLFAVGCVDKESEQNGGYSIPKNEITVQIAEKGSIDSAWLSELAIEFESLKAETSYQEDYKGVDVKIEVCEESLTGSIPLIPTNIFICEGSDISFVKELARKDALVPLDDIMYQEIETRFENGEYVPYTIDKKIDPAFKSVLQGDDDVYYAIPTSAKRGGIVFDKNVFDKYFLYFADTMDNTNTNVVNYNSKFGKATFLAKTDDVLKQAVKSVGPDGAYNTEDDGLPSSLQELFILCDYMSSGALGARIEPFTACGDDSTFKEYLVDAIWASIARFEEYQAHYSFDGYVNVVTDVTQTPAFEGIDYVFEPVVERVKVIPDKGYLANNSVARYWAISALKVIETEGWFSDITSYDTADRTQTIRSFLFNGTMLNDVYYPIKAMLIENDSWYNYSVEKGLILEYNACMSNRPLKTSWLPMPVKAKGMVTPNVNSSATPYFEAYQSNGAMVINKMATRDDVTLQICKEFLSFINTDYALAKYTTLTGLFRCGINYSIPKYMVDQMPYVRRNLVKTFSVDNAEAGVYSKIRTVSPVKTAMYNTGLTHYWSNGEYVGNLGSVVSSKAYTVQDLFFKSCTSAERWQSIKNGVTDWSTPEPEEDNNNSTFT